MACMIGNQQWGILVAVLARLEDRVASIEESLAQLVGEGVTVNINLPDGEFDSESEGVAEDETPDSGDTDSGEVVDDHSNSE